MADQQNEVPSSFRTEYKSTFLQQREARRAKFMERRSQIRKDERERKRMDRNPNGTLKFRTGTPVKATPCHEHKTSTEDDNQDPPTELSVLQVQHVYSKLQTQCLKSEARLSFLNELIQMAPQAGKAIVRALTQAGEQGWPALIACFKPDQSTDVRTATLELLVLLSSTDLSVGECMANYQLHRMCLHFLNHPNGCTPHMLFLLFDIVVNIVGDSTDIRNELIIRPANLDEILIRLLAQHHQHHDFVVSIITCANNMVAPQGWTKQDIGETIPNLIKICYQLALHSDEGIAVLAMATLSRMMDSDQRFGLGPYTMPYLLSNPLFCPMNLFDKIVHMLKSGHRQLYCLQILLDCLVSFFQDGKQKAIIQSQLTIPNYFSNLCSLFAWLASSGSSFFSSSSSSSSSSMPGPLSGILSGPPSGTLSGSDSGSGFCYTHLTKERIMCMNNLGGIFQWIVYHADADSISPAMLKASGLDRIILYLLYAGQHASLINRGLLILYDASWSQHLFEWIASDTHCISVMMGLIPSFKSTAQGQTIKILESIVAQIELNFYQDHFKDKIQHLILQHPNTIKCIYAILNDKHAGVFFHKAALDLLRFMSIHDPVQGFVSFRVQWEAMQGLDLLDQIRYNVYEPEFLQLINEIQSLYCP